MAIHDYVVHKLRTDRPTLSPNANGAILLYILGSPPCQCHYLVHLLDRNAERHGAPGHVWMLNWVIQQGKESWHQFMHGHGVWST